MANPLLTVDHLTKTFPHQQTPVLKDVSFTVHQGEVVALLGRSGEGKSTLIRTLNGLESFQAGTITFEDAPVEPTASKWLALRQKIGMVFQSYDLFPNLTVMQNLTLAPVQVLHLSPAEATTAAADLLASVGLSDFADRYPRQLSGGQKQRVAIIRALAMKPEMMLFDEVTASLDPEMVRGVLDMLVALAKQQMTMIVVTHEMAFARQIADRVLFLEGGTITVDLPAETFFTAPPTASTQTFLASMAN